MRVTTLHGTRGQWAATQELLLPPSWRQQPGVYFKVSHSYRRLCEQAHGEMGLQRSLAGRSWNVGNQTPPQTWQSQTDLNSGLPATRCLPKEGNPSAPGPREGLSSHQILEEPPLPSCRYATWPQPEPQFDLLDIGNPFSHFKKKI